MLAATSSDVAQKLLIKRNASVRDEFEWCDIPTLTLNIVVLGASGDLAKKKTYPALFLLYIKGYVHPHIPQTFSTSASHASQSRQSNPASFPLSLLC